MSDAPPTYFALSRLERDILLAAAQLTELEGRVSGQDIQRQVETIRTNERPGNNGTYSALDALRGWGWMDKSDDGFRVTDDGFDVLASAKLQLPL
jgi:hypothetical protein